MEVLPPRTHSQDVESGPVRAQPQVVEGKAVWPEHWGLTRAQVQELLRRLRSDSLWRSENTVYALVKDFVVPWTQGKGVGYALLANPTPQEVNVMVSHAWGENAEDFLEAVLRATGERDVVYVCALANYQAEDGAGPSIQQQLGSDPAESPFRRVLQHIRSCGAKAGWSWRARPWLLQLPNALLLAGVLLLCGPVIAGMLEQGLWRRTETATLEPARRRAWDQWLPWSAGVCAVAALLHAWLPQRAPIYPGRMVVVPNRQGDVYSRLWCVYEIFIARTLALRVELAPTLAVAGKVSSCDASCGSEADLQRIRGEIESSHFGYQDIDGAVRRVTRNVCWHMLGVLTKYVVLFVAPTLAGPYQSGDLILPYLAFYTVLISAAYWVARRTQGVFRASGWAICASIATVVLRVAFQSWMIVSGGAEKLGFLLPVLLDLLTIEVEAAAVVFLGALCNPCRVCFCARSRSATLAGMYLLGACSNFFLVHRLFGAPLSRAEFWNACWYSLGYIFPVYMWWTESLQWGISVSSTTGCPRCLRVAAYVAFLLWATEVFLRRDLWLWYFTDA